MIFKMRKPKSRQTRIIFPASPKIQVNKTAPDIDILPPADVIPDPETTDMIPSFGFIPHPEAVERFNLLFELSKKLKSSTYD
jgi:hypothetical protein